MIDDEIIREFLVESQEGLDKLDREFLALEDHPQARDRIATIFRTIHSIKGTCGFFGFPNLESLAHAGESLLVRLRDGEIDLTPPMTSALLCLVDRLRLSLKSIETSGQDSSADNADLLEQLSALKNQNCADVPTAVKVSEMPAVLQTDAVLQIAAVPEEGRAPQPAPPQDPPHPVASSAEAGPAVTEAPPLAMKHGEPAARIEPEARPPDPPAAETTAAAEVSDSNVRVDVGLLDKLMNLVGELVLARNQILQYGARIEDLAFVGASQRLNLITTELQEQVMRTRMQPIGNVWNRLPRVVRDLAVSCGKQVRVEMIGQKTELDRTIIEAIKDPLTHIVRNAVDHGIEIPDVRAAQGKPRTGTLTLRAFHEGGMVNIEMADDGAGLKLDRVRSKAVDRHLITPEQAARMSDYELAQLVFLPGFSTAEKVTNVSGRGVGMDVVKTHIERIGGGVDLVSETGVGTKLKIRIPLTLAIVPALVVVSAKQRYAIPQTNLLELVRLEGDEAAAAIEYVHGAPVYRLRGKLLPLVDLGRVLGVVEDEAGARRVVGEPAAPSAINIIVLQADETQIGLLVDEVRDTEEIVVKPLGKELKGIAAFAGATIMGDGRVALILDVMGLAQQVGAVARSRERRVVGLGSDALKHHAAESKTQSLLLFNVGTERVMAIPLAMVARIEEIPGERIECAGSSTVVQYRGELLPLIDLTGASSEQRRSRSGPIPIVVYAEDGHSVGFVVTRILDVVEQVVRLEQCTSQEGVLGSAVVEGRVVDLLDVNGVIGRNAPWFFKGAAA